MLVLRFRATVLAALAAGFVAALVTAMGASPVVAQFLESSPAFSPSNKPVKKPRQAQKKKPAPAGDQTEQPSAQEAAQPPTLGPATQEAAQPPTLGPAAQEGAAQPEQQPAPVPDQAAQPPSQEAAPQEKVEQLPVTEPPAGPQADTEAPAQEQQAAQPPSPDPSAEPEQEQTAQPPEQEPAQTQRQAAQPPAEGEPASAAPEQQATGATLPAFVPPAGKRESSQETTAALSPPKVAQRAPYPPPNEGCRNTENFHVWLARFKQDAAAAGVRPATISSVLDGMGVDNKVISRDRGQKFFAQSFLDFQAKLATQNRVVNGRKKIAQHKAIFERANRDFGVPASVVTGFWALESDFGAGMGNFPILPSLVTLAYDCRRQVMFQEELKAALQIIDRGDLHPGQMIGSWAGEIGQTQFLPTRYLDHALDYDKDGRIDLFRDEADVIGTTANYMHHLGWRPNEPWLEEVRITQDLPWDQADLAIKLPRSKWASWGITYPDGKPVPNDGMPASLLLPMGRFGPAFLAYPNFDIYTEWNNSLTYATTAAYLATRIDGAGPMSRGRGQIPELDQASTKELQQILVKRGYDVGKIDGLAGSKTRAAVKDVQLKMKMPADSYPTPELLSALRGG